MTRGGLLGVIGWTGLVALALLGVGLLFVLAAHASVPGGDLQAVVVHTILATVLALCMAIPAAAATAVSLHEVLPGRRAIREVRRILGSMDAVPPLVFGVMTVLMLRDVAPGLVAVVMALAIAVVPGLALASMVAFAGARNEERLAAAALGANPMQITVHVVWPAVRKHAVSGLLRAAARILGAAAPLLLLVDAPDTAAYRAYAIVVEHPQQAAGLALALVVSVLALHGAAGWLDRTREWGE